MKTVPLQEAKKGDWVEIELGVPWPRDPNKQKVTGRVVQIKKDGTKVVDVSRGWYTNPKGHPNEDVAYCEFKP